MIYCEQSLYNELHEILLPTFVSDMMAQELLVIGFEGLILLCQRNLNFKQLIFLQIIAWLVCYAFSSDWITAFYFVIYCAISSVCVPPV